MSERASNRMGRPRREDRESVAETTLTIRLTMAEKEGLERLVEKRQEALRREHGMGIMLSMAGYIRSIIAREVEANGETVKPSVQAPERPAAQPPAPSARDLVLATVRRLADRQTGLVSVPVVVKACDAESSFDTDTIIAALLELDPAELELRPESGVTSKTRGDASLCPRGAGGVVLSMVRDRRHAAPEPAKEAPAARPLAVDAESLRKRMGKASKAGHTIRALAAETGLAVGTLAPFKSGKPLGDEKRMRLDAALRRHGF